MDRPDRFIEHLPRWIFVLTVAGTVIASARFGMPFAGGFMVGSIGAWINLRMIARAVEGIASAARKGKPGDNPAAWVFFQFTGLVLGAFVILRYSGFSVVAAFCGFLTFPAAVLLEILYELTIPIFKK